MEDKRLEQIEGTVEHVVFHSDETGFTVLELSFGDELITVVGEMAAAAAGEQLTATGNFVSHPTYGSQFKAQAVERTMPATANAIYKYLASGAIKGVGPALAQRIVDQFGDQSLEVMEKEPMLLRQVRGISPKKAGEIAEEFKRIFGVRTVMLFLSRYQVDPVTSIKVWKLWGSAAIELIQADPFILCCDEIGLDFMQADAICQAMELSPLSDQRIRAGISYVLRHNLNNGHVCLPYSKLVPTAAGLLEVEPELVEDALQGQREAGELIGDTVYGTEYIYLPQMYASETYIAGRLKMMLMQTPPVAVSYDKDIVKIEQALGIEYATLQRRAIQCAMNAPVFILTGGPGTGKTTTLNGMIALLEDKGLRVALAAPTGRAAKRMSEVTGHEAKTIHRLLEVDYRDRFGKNAFKRGEKNPLAADVVIIDEMSMVDTLLFESLVKALKMGSRLIMVGDPDQLPSVSAGNVLKDLISSGMIETVHLNEVFRQAAQSLIVTNAHAIVAGHMPEVSRRDSDFFFMGRNTYEDTVETVVQLCTTRLPKSYGYSSFWDIQVITPSRIGPLGTVELNRRLQEALNPPSDLKTEMKHMAYVFREGDKVMQIKNNYDIEWSKEDGEKGMGVFNGDIGLIEMIDRPTQTILVRFDDRTAAYQFEMADELELAYAITVHKSQGSEFDAVIMPLMGYHEKLYYRNLLYTAVTRAKKTLIVLGRLHSLTRMVQNDKKTLRYTNLAAFLRDDCGCGENYLSV